MNYLVFGSLNIDRTYSVEQFVGAGETRSASQMELYCGGKGFNQAVALTRAGKQVSFAGAVGVDGQMLLKALEDYGIDVRFVKKTNGASGHAVIQVDPSGQNCILILAGANGEITRADADQVLESFEAGDLLLLQNEISNTDYILRRAAEKGMVIALNPSPWDSRILDWELDRVDHLLINEHEGSAMAGCSDPEQILDVLHSRWPNMNIVLTLGKQGCIHCGPDGRRTRCGIYQTATVDTTAAGDTFTGYYLARITESVRAEDALWQAAVASGISVSRKGAAPSIPLLEEVTSAQ